MSIFKKHNIYVYDIDSIFIKTNKQVCQYLIDHGLPLSFDYSIKDNQRMYIHHFLIILCNFLLENPNKTRMVFYSNTLTKDPFRNKVIEKVKKIFGFKIWEGVWTHNEFIKILKDKKVEIIDDFELFITKESKPKSFKHIKKFLEKEGFKSLDTYFKDIANKMIVCG